MPYITGSDVKGHFIKWGPSGKKYYFNPDNKTSRQRAKKNAQKQAAAINANRSKKSKGGK